MKKYSIIIALLIILSVSEINSQSKNSIVELTEKDISLFPDLTSDQISVFGIRLGMSQEVVNTILSQNKNLIYYVDELHGTDDFRIYVYDKDKSNYERHCILYLIWTDNNDKLTRISFFEEFVSYLIGNSSKLMTTEFLDSNSKVSKEFLGLPDKTLTTHDIPTKQIKLTMYTFSKKGIQITIKENKGQKSVLFDIY